MAYLLIVSLLWAFSFGLIERHLSGLDPNSVAFLRLAISLLLFLPFLRPARVRAREAGSLMLIGAAQFGVMYAAYIASYQYLFAYEVALFTVFTPLWVTLLDDAMAKRFHAVSLGCALLAVAGTAVVVYEGLESASLWRGFWLVQLANACFALGQVAYRRTVTGTRLGDDAGVFAWLYIGAALITGALVWWQTGALELPGGAAPWLVLLYLGAVASGIGFFLWNAGGRRVNAGTLAVFNNLKVPLAVAVSLVVFGERADLVRLFAGGGIVLLALWGNERTRVRSLPFPKGG